jgi:oligoribonuclease
VTTARSETPKSAKESQISSAPTGTNSALVTIAAITTICGRERNTRRMLVRWMPKLEAHFHYPNLDVSTLKEL